MEILIENVWYWITFDRKDWFPAMRYEHASGGWSNMDTWEDFDNKVIAWQKITNPEDSK